VLYGPQEDLFYLYPLFSRLEALHSGKGLLVWDAHGDGLLKMVESLRLKYNVHPDIVNRGGPSHRLELLFSTQLERGEKACQQLSSVPTYGSEK